MVSIFYLSLSEVVGQAHMYISRIPDTLYKD